MPERKRELEELVERARRGDQDAAREIVEEWGWHLRYVIERNPSHQARALLDSQDIEQSAWGSFFARLIHLRGRQTPEDLLRLLKIVAHNKTVEKNRHFERQKNDRRGVQSLEQLGAVDEEQLVSREPGPQQAAMAEEWWDRLLEGQPDHYRQILLLLRQGYTRAEVAQMLRLNEKTVRRVLGQAVYRLPQQEARP